MTQPHGTSRGEIPGLIWILESAGWIKKRCKFLHCGGLSHDTRPLGGQIQKVSERGSSLMGPIQLLGSPSMLPSTSALKRPAGAQERTPTTFEFVPKKL